MADEYTPTTDEVRSMFTVGISDPTNPKPVPARRALHEFDRWLAAHDREVKAKALRDASEWLDDTQTPDKGYPRDIPLILHGWADQIEQDA